ncbi:hypothetical protein HK101_001145, partial [Irineochytrium annulatum]
MQHRSEPTPVHGVVAKSEKKVSWSLFELCSASKPVRYLGRQSRRSKLAVHDSQVPSTARHPSTAINGITDVCSSKGEHRLQDTRAHGTEFAIVGNPLHFAYYEDDSGGLRTTTNLPTASGNMTAPIPPVAPDPSSLLLELQSAWSTTIAPAGSLAVPLSTLTTASACIKAVAHHLSPSPNLRSALGLQPTLWPDLAAALVRVRNELLMCFSSPDECGVACGERAVAVLDLVASHFHLARNLCAGVPHNQRSALECGMEVTAEEILSYQCSWLLTTTKPCLMVRGRVETVVHMGTQMLANVMTGNEAVMDHLWPRLCERSCLLIQILRASSSTTPRYLLMLLYNCTYRSAARSRVMTASQQGQELVIHLLKSADRLLGGEDTSFEMIFGVFANLIDLGLGVDVFRTLCRSNLPRKGLLSAPHVVLMKMLDGAVEGAYGTEAGEPLRRDVGPLFGEDWCALYVKVLWKLVKSLEAGAAAVKGGAAVSQEEAEEAERTNLVAMVLILQYFGRALAGEGEEQAIVGCRRRMVMADGLGSAVLALMMVAEKMAPPVTLKSGGGNAEEERSAWFMVRCDAMKVVAGLCYGCSDVQDEFRRIGGLGVVLSCCKVDDGNPHLKEWAIFAIRNLCDNNPENQALIASLEPRALAPDDGTLQAAGLTARLTPEGR